MSYIIYEWSDDSSFCWIDDDSLSWISSSAATLRQFWYDNNYLFVTTVSGLVIRDIVTGTKLSYISYDDGFTAIWGSDTIVYLGTVSNGMCYINKEEIVFDVGIFTDITHILKSFELYYRPVSNHIKFLHGSGDNIAVVTDVGINVLNNTNNGFISTYSGSNITKCYLTKTNGLYYVSSSNIDILYSIKYSLCDWVNEDYSYACDGSFFPEDTEINDLHITENTTLSGFSDTLFIATNSGVYVVDNDTKLYDHYFDFIPDMSDNIISIHTSPYANRNSGKLYITSTGKGAASITFLLNNKNVYDIYTETQKGRANVTLQRNDIIDAV